MSGTKSFHLSVRAAAPDRQRFALPLPAGRCLPGVVRRKHSVQHELGRARRRREDGNALNAHRHRWRPVSDSCRRSDGRTDREVPSVSRKLTDIV